MVAILTFLLLVLFRVVCVYATNLHIPDHINIAVAHHLSSGPCGGILSTSTSPVSPTLAVDPTITQDINSIHQRRLVTITEGITTDPKEITSWIADLGANGPTGLLKSTGNVSVPWLLLGTAVLAGGSNTLTIPRP